MYAVEYTWADDAKVGDLAIDIHIYRTSDPREVRHKERFIRVVHPSLESACRWAVIFNQLEARPLQGSTPSE